MPTNSPNPTQNFWRFYLHEHKDHRNRAVHLAGTTLAALCIAAAVLFSPWFLVGALVGGYGFAWFGHFFFEHNRPATFRYPLQSLASDWRMWGLWLVGRLGQELDRNGVPRPQRTPRTRPHAS